LEHGETQKRVAFREKKTALFREPCQARERMATTPDDEGVRVCVVCHACVSSPRTRETFGVVKVVVEPAVDPVWGVWVGAMGQGIASGLIRRPRRVDREKIRPGRFGPGSG
jgi:hypothetical protein